MLRKVKSWFGKKTPIVHVVRLEGVIASGRSLSQNLNAKKGELAPVLFPSISEQDREHQLSEINGELNALAKASQNCSK